MDVVFEPVTAGNWREVEAIDAASPQRVTGFARDGESDGEPVARLHWTHRGRGG